MLVFSRKELYKRNDVQKLLKALKEGIIGKIEPKFSLEEGSRYVDIENLMNLSEENVKTVLEELVNDGILVKELLETRITCPKCGSLKASLKLKCPACGSPSLKKETAIEHVKCGYIDFETVFENLEGGMTCPKCNSTLSKEDYRNLGFLYKCLICGEFSKAPRRMLVCGECGHEYGEEDAVPFEIYGYSVNENRREIIEVESLDLSAVVKKLRTSFWEAEISVFLKGKSGLEHPFTLMAYKPGSKKNGNETNIMVDVVFEERGIDETSVISLFSKVLDFNVKHVILIGVPNIGKEARRLGESYGISMFECDKMEKVAETLWNAIKPIIEEEASKTFMEVAGILETSQALKNLLKEEPQDFAKP